MDLPKRRSTRYVTGVYALFIILFAFTLSLFYTSRCQNSPRSAKQDAPILKPQDFSDNFQAFTKKLDINKAQSENKNETSNSDNKVSDENIIAPLSIKDSSDEHSINIDGFNTPSGDAINPSANPVRSQPNPKSDNQKNIIYFSDESTGLTDKALDKLRTIYLVLLKNPDVELIIEGYGDSSKTNRHNKNISKLRANIVKGYFVKREISNSRIKTFWMGSENPAKVNVSQKDKNKSRQVEIKFKMRSMDKLK